MSRETFIRGFCKAAEARGMDPWTLAKYAENSYQGINGDLEPQDDGGLTFGRAARGLGAGLEGGAGAWMLGRSIANARNPARMWAGHGKQIENLYNHILSVRDRNRAAMGRRTAPITPEANFRRRLVLDKNMDKWMNRANKAYGALGGVLAADSLRRLANVASEVRGVA